MLFLFDVPPVCVGGEPGRLSAAVGDAALPPAGDNAVPRGGGLRHGGCHRGRSPRPHLHEGRQARASRHDLLHQWTIHTHLQCVLAIV